MKYTNKEQKLSVKEQIDMRLSSICRFDENCKTCVCNEEKEKYILSYHTKKSYFNIVNHFFDYCKVNYAAKDIFECEQYVNDYIQHCRKQNLNGSTQKVYMSAFRKFYDKPFDDVETDGCSNFSQKSPNEIQEKTTNKEIANSNVCFIYMFIKSK